MWFISLIAVLVAIAFDFRLWKRGPGLRDEPIAYLCFRLGHTRPHQKADGPPSELDRNGNRPFACKRCGLVFGRVAPARGTR